MPSSIQQLKRRDHKEAQVRVAIEHQRLMRKNMHMYKKIALQEITKYKMWCKDRDVEPTLNFVELYKEVNQ